MMLCVRNRCGCAGTGVWGRRLLQSLVVLVCFWKTGISLRDATIDFLTHARVSNVKRRYGIGRKARRSWGSGDVNWSAGDSVGIFTQ